MSLLWHLSVMSSWMGRFGESERIQTKTKTKKKARQTDESGNRMVIDPLIATFAFAPALAVEHGHEMSIHVGTNRTW